MTPIVGKTASADRGPVRGPTLGRRPSSPDRGPFVAASGDHYNGRARGRTSVASGADQRTRRGDRRRSRQKCVDKTAPRPS